MAALALSLAAAALGPGCGKGGGAGATGGAAAPAHVSGTPHTDAVLEAWKEAGLSTEKFTAVQPLPYGASYCEEGHVQGLDALICEYADDGAVDRGQKALKDDWSRQGIQTGVALRTKRTLMAVIDKGRQDPNGKTINKLVTAFRKL